MIPAAIAKLPSHFSGPFHNRTSSGTCGSFGQAAVALRLFDVVQDVDDVRAADARRIVDARVLVRRVLAQLLRARVSASVLHVVFGAEVQAAGGTRLDARRLQSRAHAIGAQRALVDLLGLLD